MEKLCCSTFQGIADGCRLEFPKLGLGRAKQVIEMSGAYQLGGGGIWECGAGTRC